MDVVKWLGGRRDKCRALQAGIQTWHPAQGSERGLGGSLAEGAAVQISPLGHGYFE